MWVYKNRPVCEFVVTRIDNIVNDIVPFFDKHNIKGSKLSNYLYFKDAALIIKGRRDGESLKKVLELKRKMSGLNKAKNNRGND